MDAKCLSGNRLIVLCFAPVTLNDYIVGVYRSFEDDKAAVGFASNGATAEKGTERMKLKASVDYGVRAVMYLAAKGDTCSSREISEEMSVPRDYLIQLALRLRNAGIIKARPGKNGGYVLAKDPSEISIGQVLDAFDNDLKHARQEMKKGRRVSKQAALVRDVHALVMESLNTYLYSISVADLLESMDGGEKTANELIAAALREEADRLAG